MANRHVVIDEAEGHKPEVLKVRLHANPKDLTKNIDRDIPLYGTDGQTRWHVHPNYSSSNPIDVAVVELDQKTLTTGAYWEALGNSNFLPDSFVMNPGEDVMVIGFPLGLSDQKHNLPLIRNALVSSAYGIDFNGAPVFLVDTNLHQEMSGSPVFTKLKSFLFDRQGNMRMEPTPSYFLGVFSAILGEKEALGLGKVWDAKLIDEIIASIK